MIPFQLSPVDTWKSVRKAIPKFSKVAWRLMPSQGFSSLHTEKQGERNTQGRTHFHFWDQQYELTTWRSQVTNGISTLPNSWLLATGMEKSLMAHPRIPGSVTLLLRGILPACHWLPFFLINMARDVNKLSQIFSCNLEDNVRDRVQEKQMFKNVRENRGCFYFVRPLGQQQFRGKFLLYQLCIRENKVRQVIQSLYWRVLILRNPNQPTLKHGLLETYPVFQKAPLLEQRRWKREAWKGVQGFPPESKRHCQPIPKPPPSVQKVFLHFQVWKEKQWNPSTQMQPYNCSTFEKCSVMAPVAIRAGGGRGKWEEKACKN